MGKKSVALAYAYLFSTWNCTWQFPYTDLSISKISHSSLKTVNSAVLVAPQGTIPTMETKWSRAKWGNEKTISKKYECIENIYGI